MLRNWWTRECGGRDVLNIALPLVISTGSLSLMLFVDRMLLLWHSSAEMVAAMVEWSTDGIEGIPGIF